MLRCSFILRICARTCLFLFLVVTGTTWLLKAAPGYYSDVRELDGRNESLRKELAQDRQENAGSLPMSLKWLGHAVCGDLGRSRQYDVPVTELLSARFLTTLRLLVNGLMLGWAGAVTVVLTVTLAHKDRLETLLLAGAATALVLPVGALSILCFSLDTGGPVAVLALITSARDVQFLQRLLRDTLTQPSILYCRSCGMRRRRVFLRCVVPQLLSQLLSLVLVSFLTAASMLVPIEVIFDVPGLGQLAWAATINRDLPVLLSITAILSLGLMFAGAVTDFSMEPSQV